ncbi:MAG: hemerythrin family protein [Candidatus Marinimicrobia bacterium]|jgi:hemerythrin-like metal-binding protein|nr:hemerythrin family protein [Candidatus Neomarinimicrobiota bacterium]MBT4362679.1 hemerythrin family protein [Candidatus Neomarinimicrobiota bacterium]MBT4713311.1 hemerythrin family protein [Candidatus Neomarinimicrobiota bacterium]MBT4944832.1 hemerythrin family protein [Candidatus Neomarinimicrobiota bacterium]MBT5271668.1 hemerythrin family protein [Candidatus Neomarinimicrobiota bacterium]
MQVLVWEERFSVGIRQFDQHHKILFEMINSLIFAQEDNSDPEVIKNTLEQLRSYTIFHFIAEEAMLKHFGFEGLDEHIAEHEKLLQQVILYQERITASDGVTLDEILEFLAGWLLDHTLGLDQLYGPFLSRYTD